MTGASRVAALVDAVDEVLGSLLRLGGELTEQEWELATGCPGWTVRDCYSHVVGLEREMSGEAVPDVPLPDLDRLGDPVRRHMELAVEQRRSWPPERVLDELAAVVPPRMEALRRQVAAEGDDAAGPAIMGMTAPFRRTLPIRVVDLWSHEQDVRRATARPGHLEGAAVEVVLERMGGALGARLAAAGGTPGDVAAFEIVTPSPRVLRVVAGEGRADDDRRAPALTLRCSLEDFAARIFGRRDARGGWLGDIEAVQGDAGIAARFVDNLALTP